MKQSSVDELLEKISFLNDIIEYMPTGVLVDDKEGQVMMMNQDEDI